MRRQRDVTPREFDAALRAAIPRLWRTHGVERTARMLRTTVGMLRDLHRGVPIDLKVRDRVWAAVQEIDASEANGKTSPQPPDAGEGGAA